MVDSIVSARRTRTKGPESAARSEALQRLKALRNSTNRRSEPTTPQVKLSDPIYDTVPESDYAALVAKRRDDFGDFIVDDDGLGYTDDGHEEDWANPNPNCHSDSGSASGSDKERKDPRRRKSKREEAKKSAKPPPNPVVRQRISSMFTSSAFRKNERTVKAGSLGSESIIDDVLAEFAPDENDREERRRRISQNLPENGQRLQVKNEIRASEMVFSSNSVEILQENGGLIQENDGDAVPMEIKEGMESVSDVNVVVENCNANVEVKVEEVKEFCLNAKIKVEKNESVLSATEGWKAACGDDGNVGGEGAVSESNLNVDENSDFGLNADGLLPFYIIDAHEEFFGGNLGTLYLFGKVKSGGAYHSCCVVVKNIQRCIYAIPDSSIFPTNKLVEMEIKTKESQDPSIAFRSTLQEMASELKNEIAERLLKLNVSTFTMMPVKRSYAFERTDIPAGENYVLKINYPFKDPPLPADLKGENFTSLLGTHSSALELFLVKRKIKGPSWLSISRFVSCPASQRVSWCKFEIVVDCPKDISDSASNNLEIPQLIVAAINLKTIITLKHNASEIVAASVVCCRKAKIDGPMVASEWKRKGALSHFTVVRKLDGGIFPMGLVKEVAERNSKAGSNILTLESSERALLNRLMIELYKLDCDVLVGHNISGFDLDILLHRVQACKVPSSMWSKIGRLKRSVMPKLTRGNSLYGSGASLGIMSCIAGRLLCDTYLCSRDLLREVSYSLTQLAKTQLNKDRKEITPHDIPDMFQASGMLLQLVEYGETDAWLSLELMFHLSILPLTWQLTRICGNLWGKTLQGARAQRVEYLLLHSFHEKKYMVPDKMTAQSKESTTMKRKLIATGEGEDAEGIDASDVSPVNDGQHVDRGKGRKGPAYSGGLVLEPKKGLYDKYILLLDFNSLYPSIIQEYNICFTTVERSTDGQAPNLPPSKAVGVLPMLLKNLVERRRMVKSWMKTASGLKLQQFDIQQQALKLTANSMYGCLGFSNSRFYAKPLAELITLQGREILQSTVDLVQNNLNLEVIYGDTDSIMIYSGLDDIAKAKAIATKVIQEVNKKYRCLEIDLDGLYKRMLLLKKKKYAAVKVQFKDGIPYEVIERKGLDMVRRDWSLLSKEIGDFCLGQILSGGTCEDVVETIHSYLMKVKEEMKNGEVALEKYVITKSLTKPPEDYPDAKNQPHVQVALRLKQNGYSGCSAGDTVPYVICCQQDTGSTSTGIAQRARHPDELKRDNGSWMIDIDYYLSQQIHPVISRLCASIQGTSQARLADCLGLDSSKFKSKTVYSVTKDSTSVLLSVMDDNERYHGCEPLWISCPSCSCTFECPPTSSLVSTLSNENTSDSGTEKTPDSFWRRMHCQRCPDDAEGCKVSAAIIANQVKRQAENFISLYYIGTMTCDDEMCKYTTRAPNLRVVGDSERGTVCPNYPRCNGHLVRQYTEADLYKQLSYFCYVVDTTRCIEKADQKSRALIEREFATVRSAVDFAAKEIQKIRDRCAYGWVQLSDLAVSV